MTIYKYQVIAPDRKNQAMAVAVPVSRRQPKKVKEQGGAVQKFGYRPNNENQCFWQFPFGSILIKTDTSTWADI